MIELRFDELDLDESPPTIAYAMLSMLASVLNFNIEVHNDMYGEEWVVATTPDGDVIFRIGVEPFMGRILVSILDQVASQLTGTVDNGW